MMVSLFTATAEPKTSPASRIRVYEQPDGLTFGSTSAAGRERFDGEWGVGVGTIDIGRDWLGTSLRIHTSPARRGTCVAAIKELESPRDCSRSRYS